MNKSRLIILLRVNSPGSTGRTFKGNRAQRHAREGLEFENQPKQVMAQSRRDQRQNKERA